MKMLKWMKALPALSQIRRVGVRSMSSSLNLIRADNSNVAVLQMNRPPDNSLSLDMITEMQINVEKLENDRTCRGLILSSMNPSIFSAGIDINEVYDPDVDRLREYIRTLQNLFIKLYGSRLATIAAISGNSYGAGSVLSLCSDHRISANEQFTFGLKETVSGVDASLWFSELLTRTVGHGEAARALQLGKVYSPEESLKVGLVDELQPKDKVVEAAYREMSIWLRIPDHARVLTKQNLRHPLIQTLLKKQDEDTDNLITLITRPIIQGRLRAFKENLEKK